MDERWDKSYITMILDNERFTLKLVHYIGHGAHREWYRVYPQGFDIRKEASKQPFGYGKTLQQAMTNFCESLRLWKNENASHYR